MYHVYGVLWYPGMLITTYLTLSVHRRVRVLAAMTGSSISRIAAEAIAAMHHHLQTEKVSLSKLSRQRTIERLNRPPTEEEKNQWGPRTKGPKHERKKVTLSVSENAIIQLQQLRTVTCKSQARCLHNALLWYLWEHEDSVERRHHTDLLLTNLSTFVPGSGIAMLNAGKEVRSSAYKPRAAEAISLRTIPSEAPVLIDGSILLLATMRMSHEVSDPLSGDCQALLEKAKNHQIRGLIPHISLVDFWKLHNAVTLARYGEDWSEAFQKAVFRGEAPPYSPGATPTVESNILTQVDRLIHGAISVLPLDQADVKEAMSLTSACHSPFSIDHAIAVASALRYADGEPLYIASARPVYDPINNYRGIILARPTDFLREWKDPGPRTSRRGDDTLFDLNHFNNPVKAVESNPGGSQGGSL